MRNGIVREFGNGQYRHRAIDPVNMDRGRLSSLIALVSVGGHHLYVLLPVELWRNGSNL